MAARFHFSHCAVFLGLAVACAAAPPLKAAAITRLKLDPKAPVVELFQGIANGTLGSRVVPHNEFSATIYLTNRTPQPVTVAMPKAVVAVQQLKQFFPQQNQPQNGLQNVLDGTLNGNGANGSSSQRTGGTVSSSGQQGFPGGAPSGISSQFPGNNFFSIPAEKTVQLTLHSVCLDYGKPTPHSRLTYRLQSLDEFTADPVLKKLIQDYRPGKTSRQVQQAAVWNQSSRLSWQAMAQLRPRLGGISAPLFPPRDIESARLLVKSMEEAALKTKPPARAAASQSAGNQNVVRLSAAR